MSDIRPGPYTIQDSSIGLKLEPPTRLIQAGDGSLVLAASAKGNSKQLAQVEAALDVAVNALNGSGSDAYREALEAILSSDVTSAAAAKEIARAALEG